MFFLHYSTNRVKHTILTPEVRNAIKLTQVQREILVGNMLGDATAIRTSNNTNTRIKFEQTYPKHEAYVRHVYDQFSNLTTLLGPRIGVRQVDKRTGLVYKNISFITRCLPCLNEFRELFYGDLGKKKIPDTISDMLTARGLAYWIIDDGHLDGGTVLNTNSYLLSDVQKLQEVLKDHFGLRSTLRNKRLDE